MPSWTAGLLADLLPALLAVVGGLLVLWLVLLAVLAVQRRRVGGGLDLREAVRLVPDVVVLVRRLATDPAVPRGTRWALYGLLGYLLLPVDLVPDVIPVLGYADDVLVVALVLRLAVRHAGVETLRARWPGTTAGLAAVLTLVGLPPGTGRASDDDAG